MVVSIDRDQRYDSNGTIVRAVCSFMTGATSTVATITVIVWLVDCYCQLCFHFCLPVPLASKRALNYPILGGDAGSLWYALVELVGIFCS